MMVMGKKDLPRLLSEGSGETPEPVGVLSGGFSLDLWLRGRAPATRTVRVYGSLSLFGEREALGEDLQVAKAAGDTTRVEALKQEIDALTLRMQEDVIDFKLQNLTQSRKLEVLEASKEFGDDDSVRALAFMLSEFIVEPEGITPDAILALSEWDDVQAGKLAQAMNDLNTRVPNLEATRPF